MDSVACVFLSAPEDGPALRAFGGSEIFRVKGLRFFRISGK